MKILVIGYGSIGKRYLDNLSRIPNMKLVVCTNRKYDKFLKSKNCVIINKLDDCINLKPNFALICNETSYHLKTAKKLAEANIDFFIEKPLSHNLNGVNKLAKIIKRKKLITMVGCNLRFHPCIKKIKELIENNAIGRIISVKVEGGSYLPEWHPYEDYRSSYASKKDLGGGVILTCIHELDYLYWFFGKIKNIISISDKVSNLDINVEDFSAMLIRFKNNILGEVHLDYFQRPSFRSCKIIGTSGTIYWDSNLNMVMIFDIKKKKWIKKMKLINYDYNSMYVDELRYYMHCLKKKKNPMNSFSDGVNILKIALSAKKSSMKNKMVVLN